MISTPSLPGENKSKERILLDPETRILVDSLLKAANFTGDVSGMTLVEQMSFAMRSAASTIDALKSKISALQEKDEGRKKASIYRDFARAKMYKDGEIEFDENLLVSRGFDAGAYVEGWSWIEEEDVINYLVQEVIDDPNRNQVIVDVVRKIVATTEDAELIGRGNDIMAEFDGDGDICLDSAKEFIALAGVEDFYKLALDSARENTPEVDRPRG